MKIWKITFLSFVIKLSLTRASKKILVRCIQVYIMDYNYGFYQNIKMSDERLITNKNRWENQKLQTFDLKILFWFFYLKYFAFNRFILLACLSVDKNRKTSRISQQISDFQNYWFVVTMLFKAGVEIIQNIR